MWVAVWRPDSIRRKRPRRTQKRHYNFKTWTCWQSPRILHTTLKGVNLPWEIKTHDQCTYLYITVPSIILPSQAKPRPRVVWLLHYTLGPRMPAQHPSCSHPFPSPANRINKACTGGKVVRWRGNKDKDRTCCSHCYPKETERKGIEGQGHSRGLRWSMISSVKKSPERKCWPSFPSFFSFLSFFLSKLKNLA